MTEIFLLLTGLLAGSLGALIGLGGGFVVVPVLIFLFDAPHAVAAGTSLVMIFFTSLSGAYAYHQQGRIDIKTGLRFALFTLPGAFIGSLLGPSLNPRIFEAFFALLTMSAALYLVFKPHGAGKNRIPPAWGPLQKRSWTDKAGQLISYSINLRAGSAISFGVGFLSSILGIGGGIVHVPAMTFLLGVPPHVATATSTYILVFSTLVGSLTYLVQGQANLYMAFWLTLGAIAGAQIGAGLAPRVDAKSLIRLFAAVMFLVAMRMIVG